jgi:hypothetical protein
MDAPSVPGPFVPKDLLEAVDYLAASISDEARAKALSQSSWEFSVDRHFSLGAWIRSYWIDVNFLQPDCKVSDDDISGWLLKQLHRRLCGMQLDPNAKPVSWMEDDER